VTSSLASRAARGWQPSFGAVPEAEGVRFHVWAPSARQAWLVLERPDSPPGRHAMAHSEDGRFSLWLDAARPGDRYRFQLDDAGPFPDPASRFQPEGVHGPSEIIDPAAFRWSDDAWRGIEAERVVIYELHVGTFTPEATFQGVLDRLPYLADLGITAIELMPVADFPGDHNWGYDGVALYAPARCYGRPDDLRRLVDAAHRAGLAVFLDVVYNHLGPDGAYLTAISPQFFSDRHSSPWGAGVNLDDRGCATVRQFLIENALHWVHEYHIDGLRLDATHAMHDDSPRHFLSELAERVQTARPGLRPLVYAEDHRNLAVMLREREAGGCGLDGVWADDFHHQVRRLLAGDREGYYQDFSGSLPDLTATIRQGWFFCGQESRHLGHARGTDPSGIPPRKFVICVQNHDQIGNRALGERLHHQIDAAAWRAASLLLLAAPETPLLFMGQEWSASTPFLYFTDHHDELGRLVTEGRRREFRHFSAFSDPAARASIPDPQAPETWQASRLKWDEQAHEFHASTLRLHRQLLDLRQREPAFLAAPDRDSFSALALDDGTVLLRRSSRAGAHFLVLVRLAGSGRVTLDPSRLPGDAVLGDLLGRTGRWTLVLTTEDEPFCQDPHPPALELGRGLAHIRFERPGGLILLRT
jgi:maltooligosyltrehalose trehalohydrolase